MLTKSVSLKDRKTLENHFTLFKLNVLNNIAFLETLSHLAVEVLYGKEIDLLQYIF